VEVVFGCETKETGEIYNQEADGILGLGNSEVSLVNQVRQVAQLVRPPMQRRRALLSCLQALFAGQPQSKQPTRAFFRPHMRALDGIEFVPCLLKKQDGTL
jgi:hypothetical protein